MVTVTGVISWYPPPNNPTVTDPPKASERIEYHCFKSASVGTTTSVLRPARSIALTATAVLPAPVGSTTTPRKPSRPHAARASLW